MLAVQFYQLSIIAYICLQLRTAYFFPVAISKPSWVIGGLVYYDNKLRF